MSNRAGPQASIGNGQTMNADAAIYWHLLVAAVAAACGVWVVATEGTRTWARQLYLWEHRNEPGFNPAWHPDDPRANHVAGRCVDVGSGVGFILTLVSLAFYRLAGSYGFRATVPGEPWHFEWRLEWVAPHIRFIAAVQAASSTITPIEEHDMPLNTDDEAKIRKIVADALRGHEGVYIINDGKREAVVGPQLFTETTGTADLGTVARLHHPAYSVNAREFDVLRSIHNPEPQWFATLKRLIGIK